MYLRHGKVGETDIYYRIYASIHHKKVAAAIRAEKKKDSVYNELLKGSPVRYDPINTWTKYTVVKDKKEAESVLYYNKVGVTFHTEPMSKYDKDSADDNPYYYSKYSNSWSEEKDLTAARSISNSKSYKTTRPLEISSDSYKKIKKVFYPMYEDSSDKNNKMIRPYRAQIFCINPSAADNAVHRRIQNASSVDNMGEISNLRTNHITVVDYKINEKGYKDIVDSFKEYAESDGSGTKGQYYIYMSDVIYTKGGPSLGDGKVYRSNTIGEYYNAIYNKNGSAPAWSINERGGTSSAKMPLASMINSFDNKFHFPELYQPKVIIRYLDVSKGGLDLDRTETSTTVKFSKQNSSNFTTGEINSMLVGKQKEITEFENDNRKMDLEIPSGYEYIGFNANPDSQLKYTSNKLTVGNKGNKTYGGTTSNKDIYIDVFLNSKKKVYVRHLNISEFYNANTLKATGISYEILRNGPKLSKSPIKATVYDKNGKVIGEKTSNYTKTGYQECYDIDYDKYLEISNIKNVSYDYVGYYKVTANKYSSAIDALKNKYNAGSITFTQGQRDVRVFTDTGTKATYIDMFYAKRSRLTCTDPVYNNGKVVPTTGKLCFESTDAKFANETKNEVNQAQMVMDKIPSSEELRYGILGLKEYIISRADTKCVTDRELVDNGKNYVEIPYEYFNPSRVTFYGLKDNIVMHDLTSQTGSTLFGDASRDYPIKLSTEYMDNLNNATLTAGTKHLTTGYDEIPCDRCHGTICRNYYVKLDIKNMNLKYKNSDLIPSFDATSGKVEIRRERCKKENGAVIVDPSKTVYITPKINKVTNENYREKVETAITNANRAATATTMTALYSDSNKATIPELKVNGMRVPSATFNYKVVNNASFGTPIDTINEKTLSVAKTEVEPVDVYTPVIAKSKLESQGTFVNHSGTEVNKENVIQKNEPFIVRPETTGATHASYTQLTEFAKYTKEFYLQFTFDVQYVEYYHNGETTPYAQDMNPKPAGQWVKVPKGDYIKSQAMFDPNAATNSVVEALESSYTVKAVAINAPAGNYTNDMLGSNILGDPDMNLNVLSHKDYHGLNLQYEYKYMAYKKQDTSVIGRIYDFRITDLVDIDWKFVFRKSDSITHTGRFYYSGTHKWNMFSSEANQMVERTESEIGTNPKRVLPIGPLKHTNTGYVNAPKLGYRFAFDIKTTGSMGANMSKEIQIKPSFYYISKDGRTYNDNINLYYKNSSGKYIKVGSASDTYKMTMRPADGLRHLIEYESSYNKKNLSTNTISVGKINSIVLSNKTNMATNDNTFLQIWYGEYKLPNSTIVVDGTTKDLNKPLTDGYIGIVFDITCVEKKNGAVVSKISYNTDDLNASGTNTTQWDYERYIGSNPGNAFTGSIKLEKGTWNINDALYKKIRGTVALYDTDNRAATDFDTGASK